MDLSAAIRDLQSRRSVFHSEADLQHELAWSIRTLNPSVRIRLELPISIDGKRGALDIFIADQSNRLGIEVKYVKGKLEGSHDGEDYSHSPHAFDFAAHDCCKDISRLEFLIREGRIDVGYLFVVCNHPPFWDPRSKGGFIDGFALRHGKSLSGTLQWPDGTGDGTRRGRDRPLALRGTYEIQWQEFSNLDCKGGRFNYLTVEVRP